MRAIIADDEQHLAEDLRRRLAQLWPELQIVAVVHDGVAAAAALTENKPDIAFLDIRMPGQSGLDAARSAHGDCRVVFVTAFDDHAVQAFEQAAVDYLLKPVSDERLARCVERLKQRSEVVPDALLMRLQQLLATPAKPEPLRWLRVQVGQTVRMLAVDEVCYFQSADKYTTVLTRDAELLLRTVERLKQRSEVAPDALLVRLQQLLATPAKPEALRWLRVQVGQAVRMLAVEEVCYFQSADKYTTRTDARCRVAVAHPLKELISQLDAEQFWQVHRGTVVNVRQIVSAHHDLLGKVSLNLRDRPEKVAVSRSYAHLFRQM